MTATDPEEIRRKIRKALRVQREYEETYEHGPVGDFLAKDPDGNYVIPSEKALGLFFHDGPTSTAAIRAYLRANGDPLDLEEYGATLFRQAGGVTADGLVDFSILDEWERRYKNALSVLPGLQNKLDEARSARVALEATKARHQAAREAFLCSPAALFLDNDPMAATEKLFALPNTAAAMRSLVDFVKGNQQAFDGLQTAVFNFVRDKVGVGPEYLKFLEKNEQALSCLFDSSKMQTFHAVAAGIRQSTLSCPESREGRLPITTVRRGWRRFFGR